MANLPHPHDTVAAGTVDGPPDGSIYLPDAAATLAAGARMAAALQAGMLICLIGDLGTGKTTLARGALRALGWGGAVKSPTYTLVEHYLLSSLYFYHFDFYRLASPNEWETAGFAEYFRPDAVCLVEWPERVGAHLPRADLEIRLAYLPDSEAAGRNATLIARTEAGARCMNAIIPGVA